jgi:hypothetical protein
MEAVSFSETLVITSQHGVIAEDIFTKNILENSNPTSKVCCNKKVRPIFIDDVMVTPTTAESQLRKP